MMEEHDLEKLHPHWQYHRMYHTGMSSKPCIHIQPGHIGILRCVFEVRRVERVEVVK